MPKKIRKRKNPANLLTSSQEFRNFIKILEKEELDYGTVVAFGSRYTEELLQYTQYLIDFATLMYFKGLIKGYSKIYKPSRYDARMSFINDLKKIDELMHDLFKNHKILPYKRIKDK